MNVEKSIATIYEKIKLKRLEIEQLLAQIPLIQRRCPHPPDKRSIVTMDDTIDRISCDECGKIMQG